VLLPIGVVVVFRRRINVLILRCAHCGVESRQCPIPFKVDRWGDVDYAYVVCSQCGADFTISKYARIV
jgi:DNA-directed RNA polymerase subunit RPC12/RpoP